MTYLVLLGMATTRVSTLTTSHIDLDAEGQAWIAGANTKVIEIVSSMFISSILLFGLR